MRRIITADLAAGKAETVPMPDPRLSGTVLRIAGVGLPKRFEVQFSNAGYGGECFEVAGKDGEAPIPAVLLESRAPIYVRVYSPGRAFDFTLRPRITFLPMAKWTRDKTAKEGERRIMANEYDLIEVTCRLHGNAEEAAMPSSPRP